MNARKKQSQRTNVSWGRILFCAFVCAVLVPCFSFLPQAQGADDPVSYRVVFVAADDTLNVRSEPGSSSPVVGTLAPSAQGIRITGEKKMVGDSAWYPIETEDLGGWVLGLFLTQDYPPEEFCAAQPVDFLGAFTDAIAKKDGEALASMVDSDRGLRLYLDPWSKGVRLSAEQLRTIFADSTKSTWGLDPDMEPVDEGTFSENVLPLLERDLLNATTNACNAMNHPEASDPHMVPQGAEGVNYYSFYRSPGADENELDWGEWVVGIEFWNGRMVLSYLAHYKWTP